MGHRIMPLINCPECEGSVSDRAARCPNCGYAFVGDGSVQTIEKARKTFKAQGLLSLLLVVGGLLLAFIGNDILWVIGMLVWVVGMVWVLGILWYYVVQYSTWWHHES